MYLELSQKDFQHVSILILTLHTLCEISSTQDTVNSQMFNQTTQALYTGTNKASVKHYSLTILLVLDNAMLYLSIIPTCSSECHLSLLMVCSKYCTVVGLRTPKYFGPQTARYCGLKTMLRPQCKLSLLLVLNLTDIFLHPP